MARGDPLFVQGQRIEHVYFPTRCVMSLLTEMKDGTRVEVATVGNEGAVGLPVFFGADSTRAYLAICQVAGPTLRMASGVFRTAIDDGSALRGVVQVYTQVIFTQLVQNFACNTAHPIGERAARWLLFTHDRIGQDTFSLTQEFLAQMLAVRRPTVNTAMRILQRAGLVRYSRGRITVVDRRRLEQASCECYGVVRDELDRLIP